MGRLVAGITVVAALLRLANIDQTTWGDELFLVEIVRGHGLGEALDIVHDTESTPPLYFVIAWAATQFGEDLLAIRIPSLVFSTATVPLIYLLGVRTVGRIPALVAATIFAITPFGLFYGTEGRGYAAVAFFSVASTLSLVLLVQTGRRRWIVALALAVAAAAYTHDLAIFVLAAQLVFALFAYREKAREVLVAHAGAALLYVPWIPGALFQFQDNTSDRLTPVTGVQEAVETVVRSWFGYPFVELGRIPGRAATWLIVLALAVAAALALRAAIMRRARPSTPLLLLTVLAAATPVAAALYELGDSSVFGARYLSASVPAALLVIAALVTASRRAAVAGGLAAAVLIGVSAGTVLMLQRDTARPDYRAAARELDRTAPPGEPIIEAAISAGPVARNLGFFLERPHPYYADGARVERAYEQGHASGRLHVVGVQSGIDGFLSVLRLPSHGFREAGRRTWPGILPMVLVTFRSAKGPARVPTG